MAVVVNWANFIFFVVSDILSMSSSGRLLSLCVTSLLLFRLSDVFPHYHELTRLLMNLDSFNRFVFVLSPLTRWSLHTTNSFLTRSDVTMTIFYYPWATTLAPAAMFAGPLCGLQFVSLVKYVYQLKRVFTFPEQTLNWFNYSVLAVTFSISLTSTIF